MPAAGWMRCGLRTALESGECDAERLLEQRWQLSPTQLPTGVQTQVQRGEESLAPVAHLFRRNRKWNTTVECLLFGLQKIQTDPFRMTRVRRTLSRQCSSELSSQHETRAVNARLDRRWLEPQHGRNVLDGELDDIFQHERHTQFGR